jgi:hypothetical protein
MGPEYDAVLHDLLKAYNSENVEEYDCMSWQMWESSAGFKFKIYFLPYIILDVCFCYLKGEIALIEVAVEGFCL